MRSFFTLVLLLICVKGLFSQTDSVNRSKIDSLRIKLKADSLKLYRFMNVRPYANIDNRNSFIRKKPVNVQGGQIGIIFKEFHAFGFGFYTVTQQSQRAQRTSDVNRGAVNQYLTLNYATFFYQYLLVDKRFFEIDLPFEIGYGSYHLKFQDVVSNEIYRNTSAPIVPLGAGVQLVLKPVRWVGFSVVGGYRYVKDNDKNLNFNGLYYSLGLWLDVRQVYRDIKYYGFIKRRYKEQVKRLMANH